MGDRTFSAEDVIRIYEDFLTSSEQETVDEFFFIEPEEPTTEIPTAFFDDIRALQGLNTQQRVVLPGLFGLVLRFIPFALTLVDTILFAATQANILISSILDQEEVDA